MNEFTKDLRYSLRLMLRQPGPAAFAVLALGLGIGLVAAVYSVVWGTLLRGLPYEGAERLMRVGAVAPGSPDAMKPVPLEMFRFLRESQSSFEDLVAWLPLAVSVGNLELYPEQVNGAFVTGNIFDLLGAEPVLGRRFAPEEDEGAAVVMIGERLWQQQLGGTSDVLGRVITIYGEPKTVIGVMSAEFRFPYNQELWVPLDPEVVNGAPWLQVFGRLRQDASRTGAAVEMTTLAGRWALSADSDLGIEVEPYEITYHDPQVRRSLELALGAVVALLLIACANVMNLLLGLGASRTRELTVRVALGASRWQVVRLLFADSLLLALGGAGLGLGVARLGIKLYEILGQAPGPYWIDIRLDGQVFAMVAAMTVGASLLVGLGPALWVSSPRTRQLSGLRSSAQASGRNESRFRRALVVGQFALSTGLLMASGLMIGKASELAERFRHVRQDEIQVMRLGTYGTALAGDAVATRAFYQELGTLVSGLPEVESSALATSWPGGGSNMHPFELDGQDSREPDALPGVHWISISPGFFDVFHLGAVSGRGFEATDRQDSEPVALLSQSFASRHGGGADVVGRRLRLIFDPDRREASTWRTIVGVVPDLIGSGGESEPVSVYLPVAQTARADMMVVLKPRPRAHNLEQKLRQIVQAAAPEVPVYFVRPLEELLGSQLRNPFTTKVLFTVFATVALLLASIGLYGVMALSVGRRSREFGLRIALGALPGNLLRQVLGRGLKQLIAGAVLGLVSAGWLGKVLSSLYQVEAFSLPIAGSVLVTLLVAGLAASYYPARKAAGAEPTSVLRHD